MSILQDHPAHPDEYLPFLKKKDEPTVICQLGDLRPGIRVYSPDGDTEYIVTDFPARDGFTQIVQLDTGTAREFQNSIGLFQRSVNPKLRMMPSFDG